MNTFSHVLLGRMLYRYIKEKTGFHLKSGSFILGNVLPDFNSFYLSKPHYQDSWEPYLRDEISKLAALRQDGESVSREASKRLGIICHFYADFFCHAHTRMFEGGTLVHMKYEWALFRYSRRRYVPANKKPRQDCPSACTDEICLNYSLLHRKYLEERPSFEHDMNYSFQACAEAVMLILSTAAKIETGGELPINAVLTVN
jgi:hypothetical protein